MTDEVNAATEAIEGEIVDGTWVNPNVSVDDARRVRRASTAGQFDYSLPEGRPSFIRMIFGSVVIFTEEVAERATAYDDDETPRQVVEAAIHQAVEQEEAVERRPFANLRYGSIGLLSGMLDSAQDGAGRISGLTNAAALTAGRIIGPLWNSFLFAPFHEPALRAEQAGEKKVEEWIRRGRVEEVRSRALAEVSINSLVEESVTDLTENPQVQLLVQEVITSQSTSAMAEILEEIRERFVSLDILFMGKLGRANAPPPEFRDVYLNDLENRRSRYKRGELRQSLAGTYSGPVTRLIAYLIDVLLLLIIAGATASFISGTLALFGLTDAVDTFLESGGVASAIAVGGITAFNMILISAYFVVAWYLTGSTVGDSLLGIQVINKEGKRVTIWRSFLRLVGAYISFVVFFLGFIWALFDRRRQGWHDKFGGTFVLYNWPARPEETFLHEQVMEEIAEEN